MNTNNDNRRLHRSRRGVAPVIATLLLVAIAVVGGAIVFAYSQNFFSSSQISGRPTIEAVKILGYDARAIDTIQNQNGVDFTANAGDNDDANKDQGEHVAVYIKNDSVQSITLSELRFGGGVYSFTGNPTIANLAAMTSGQYTIAGVGGSAIVDGITTSSVADIQPGQTVSVVLALSEDMKSGRDTQFKLTTTNGAVFVGTVVVGQQSG
ncbi:archaellin/type IV pilin N-terminal domain-containing protein [Candidatus Nitrosotenuis cloacae]|uniref:archaellin/type IV pilin N-terminal domain-containing protein n=1 Tax=Candidatus Nitrosotenuis cloacae TaxID=1603555 RepID=UPI0022826A21|nr:archaellin/type IV pilin N-terminal domain-containing protein [Candidatus Nitrosotenuis cloacae]